ncbi:MAG: hypothetical protein IPJ24_15865 [bacterium]|nr:hypothetical protein [bacterium]
MTGEARKPVVQGLRPSLPEAWPSLTLATNISNIRCEIAVPGAARSPSIR